MSISRYREARRSHSYQAASRRRASGPIIHGGPSSKRRRPRDARRPRCRGGDTSRGAPGALGALGALGARCRGCTRCGRCGGWVRQVRAESAALGPISSEIHTARAVQLRRAWQEPEHRRRTASARERPAGRRNLHRDQTNVGGRIALDQLPSQNSRAPDVGCGSNCAPNAPPAAPNAGTRRTERTHLPHPAHPWHSHPVNLAHLAHLSHLC